jgi:hypothetical protein
VLGSRRTGERIPTVVFNAMTGLWPAANGVVEPSRCQLTWLSAKAPASSSEVPWNGIGGPGEGRNDTV